MDVSTTDAIALAVDAHHRLAQRLEGLTDADVRRPSLLPDWTVGHVLTHLARNADGHVARLAGALQGTEVKRYPGGPAQRNADIGAGADRGAAELRDDVAASSAHLEAVWRESEAAGWPHADLLAGDSWTTDLSPLRRAREVELHHVDLGLGYVAAEWSDTYAAWELADGLARLPERLDQAQRREMVLWLTGRGPQPNIALGPWL